MSARIRDSRFETLRVFAMLCILLCHAVAHLPWGLEEFPGWRGAAAIAMDQFAGQVGVALFFMLSGFFLIDRPFSFQRPLKIVVQTFCYSAVCTAIALWVYPHVPALMHSDMPWHGATLAYYLYMGLVPVLNNAYWFITAYVLMILFSPLVNMAFQRLSKTQILWFMALTGFLSVMPFFTLSGFAYNGLFWTTIVYALLCYAIGGWIRLHGESLRTRISWPLAGICAVAAYAALTAFIYVAQRQGAIARFFSWKPRSIYGTIPLLAVGVAAMMLALVSGKRRGLRHSAASTGINAMASSVFGVYLIHQNWLIGNDVWKVAGLLIPEPRGMTGKAVMLVVIVVVVFAVLAACSWCFDRVAVHPIQRWAVRGLADSKLERFARSLGRSSQEDAHGASR